MGMQFNAAHLRQEFIELEAIAKKFLGRGSEGKLSAAAAQLEMIARNPEQTRTWQIDSADPLWTILSKGECERDGKGKSLVGCLSFVWTVRGDGKKQVELVDEGKASTVISIHEVDDSEADLPKDREDRCIQAWNIDVVTSQGAPGPAFHAQVQNLASVPVPRLPSLLVSPADCLDFLLGELFQFQDRWRQHQMRHVRIRSFSKYQQSRFRALLDEHLASLDQIGDSSAWTSLKDQRPRDSLFLSR
jgi:hypothetical protein